MKHIIYGNAVADLPYNRTEYTILQLTDGADNFVNAASIFFVQSWMSSALPDMFSVWQAWDNSLEEERQYYVSFLDTALFSKGKLIDDPNIGYTSPIGTFAETMLRWLRQKFAPAQLLVEPAAPQPPSTGYIDFIEVTGFPEDYSSMSVNLWEVKASDGDASTRNSEIYGQLDDYPRRFFPIANSIAASYSGNDQALKLFLRNMSKIVRNRQPQAHYGVFIAYDPEVTQAGSMVPNLHKHPPDHPLPPGKKCHHVVLLLIPNFKSKRLEVWQSLHLI